MSKSAVELQDVYEARDRIAPHAHVTPVVTCTALDKLAGRRLFFKCENLQKAGAFKFRGACNAVMQLSEKEAARGVVTHSSGNHAQALALAAKRRGIDAHIVMPTTASKVKRAAVLGYGARIIDCEPNQASRESTANQIQQETGAVLVHPYDSPMIIAGQATAALELLAEVSGIDAIIAPVGGGGLISGTCLAAKSGTTPVRVFGAEPSGADDAMRSKASGEVIPQTNANTIADGLLTSLGEYTWPFVRDDVEAIFAVDDDEAIAAMRFMWSRAKILIEISSAVAVAATLSDAFKSLPGMNRVGVILSGGNTDLDRLPWVPAA